MFKKFKRGLARFLSFMFSRFVITTLLIVGQVALLAVMLTVLSEQFLPFQLASLCLSLVLVFIIVNKQEVPEYKLPWLLIVTLLPPLGAVVYLVFGNSNVGRGVAKRYTPIRKESEKHETQNEEALEELKKRNALVAGHITALNKSSGAVVRHAGDLKYYPMGEDWFPDLMKAIKGAKHFIFMEYFIIEEGRMWLTVLSTLLKKQQEGVEVRFMYDDVGSIGKVPMNYVKKLKKMGLNAQVFRPFRPFVSVVHNNRDHRKITVVDNEIAFTGGANLADEYINEVERFGRWKDTCVRVKGECVKDFTRLFLNLWDLQANSVSDYDKYVNFRSPSHEECSPKEGFVCAYGDGPKPIYMEQVGKQVYLDILDSATKYVYITTPYLVCDNELFSAICHTAERGVEVVMITPSIPDKKSVFMITRSNYAALLKSGVKIYEYTPGFIHAKTFVSDDKVAVVGTINLDYRSLVHHYECGLWMYETDAVPAVKRDILRTIEVSQEITPEQAHLGFWQNFVKSLLQIFTPLL